MFLTNILTKLAQIFSYFLGYLVSTTMTTVLGNNFEKNWANFLFQHLVTLLFRYLGREVLFGRNREKVKSMQTEVDSLAAAMV